MHVKKAVVSAALLGSALVLSAPALAVGEEPAKAPAPTKAPEVSYTEGFATPESVLYDAEGDQYLVANIQGSPLEADNNGFISQLSPDGKVVNLKWIAGGQGGVTLNAPKGMAIAKGVLYVADLDTVRMFDRKTGKPKGEVKVEGATFLNDIAVGPDNKVYVSDSGLKAGEGGFAPSGTDAVYVLQGRKAKKLAGGDMLGRPNGLLVDKAGVHVVTFGTGELYALDAKKGQKKGEGMKLPKGGLDGIVSVAGGQVVVSSWEGQALYTGSPGGTFIELVGGLQAPADIGYDTKRQRVLVPRFMENRVEVYAVK
jgi:sugar lactone lactonase YvrE